jgi:hypothetical protein
MVAPVMVGAVIDTASRLDHHVAKPLLVEPCTTQDWRHNVIDKQIFEARLIAAAFSESSHEPLLTCNILRNMAGKHGRFMTRTRKFRGNLCMWRPQLPFKWNGLDEHLFRAAA